MSPVARAKLVHAAAVAAAVCALAAAPASAATDYETGYALGAKAYEYGVPLLDTDRIFRTNTSVSKPDHKGNAPVNRFSHARKLADAEARDVVAPNQDTLYSIAQLGLRRQPQVLHVPRMKRFYAFELVSPWTENFRNISTATDNQKGGDFAIVGPDFDGKLPKGVKRVKSPYDRVWLIGRTYIKGPGDTKKVNRIQDSYGLQPLATFGRRYKPPKIKPVDRTVEHYDIPGLGPGDDPLEFYSVLGRLMRKFPPPAADQPLLDQLAAIGVGTGLDPAEDLSLSAETLRGMRDAVTQGPANTQAEIARRYVAEFADHNGYLLGDVGHYGTDYTLRAITDKVGVGALKPKVAIYAFTQTAYDLSPLVGGERYVMHIPADQLPVPARAFWSVTMYDANVFLVPNPIDRYLMNDRSKLRYNADGSLDIYVQSTQPADPQQARNWLPSPADGGGFRLIWRLYDTGKARFGILDGTGWQPPRVQRCDATGRAPDGTACAS
jgi:hypothetical protein